MLKNSEHWHARLLRTFPGPERTATTLWKKNHTKIDIRPDASLILAPFQSLKVFCFCFCPIWPKATLTCVRSTYQCKHFFFLSCRRCLPPGLFFPTIILSYWHLAHSLCLRAHLILPMAVCWGSGLFGCWRAPAITKRAWTSLNKIIIKRCWLSTSNWVMGVFFFVRTYQRPGHNQARNHIFLCDLRNI